MVLEEQCFLTLLRDALLGLKSSPEAEQWRERLTPELQARVLFLAQMHNLFPLIAQQLLLLNPPELDRQRLRSLTMQALARQTAGTQALLVLTRALEEAGVEALVVKGAVCRSLYPSPDLRPSTDEDILVAPEAVGRAEAVLERLGYQPQKAQDNPDDPVHTWTSPRLRVELHCRLFGDFPICGRQAQSYFDGCFAGAVSWSLADGTVRTLGDQVNFLYLLLHYYKHFLAGGVGIRQLCDICLFARRRADRLDWTALWQVLRELSLDVLVWNMMDLGVRYLGMPAGCVPPAPWLPEADSGELLADILGAGIFGSSTLERKHSSLMTMQAAAARDKKAGGLRSALFPPAADLQGRYPYLRKSPWLLPVAWFSRGLHYVREGRRPGSRGAASAQIGRQRIALLEKYGILPK